MKRAPGLTLVLALAASPLVHAGDFVCLKSAGTNKPLFLQFDYPERDGAPGFVTYRSGSGRIPVKLRKTEQVELAPGRPFEFTTTWQETGPSGSGGTYTMVSQGARTYGFEYVRAKDGKVFAFDEDLESAGERACNWNRK